MQLIELQKHNFAKPSFLGEYSTGTKPVENYTLFEEF